MNGVIDPRLALSFFPLFFLILLFYNGHACVNVTSQGLCK